MIRAYWRLTFNSGEILCSSRLYTTASRAYRYLQDYLVNHYIKGRWEEGIECICYEVSICGPLDPRPEVYGMSAQGSRLFHPLGKEEVESVEAIPFHPLDRR